MNQTQTPSAHLAPTFAALMQSYVERGFHLVPVAPGAKNPLGEKWQNLATNKIETLLQYSKDYPKCNWGLYPVNSNLVVIDVDNKRGGLEYWEDLTKDLDINTMTQQTPGGGFHYIFKAKPGLIYGSPLSNQGIDCQWKRIIVVHPSVNAAGIQYRWLNEGAIQELPSELELLFARKRGENKPENLPTTGLKEYFEKIAEQLKKVELDYNTWVQIGMTLHSAMPGEDGLKIWQDISHGPSYNEGDEEQCRYKWNGFSKRDDGLSHKSLGFIARSLGCNVPNMFLEQDKLAFATEQQKIELEAEHNKGWFIDSNGRLCTRHEDFLIDSINNEGWFLVTEGSSSDVGRLLIDENGHREASFISPQAFKLQLDNKFLKDWVWSPQKGWSEKYTKASKIWLESSKRKQYQKLVFDPLQTEKNCLNLWSPIPTTPISGDVQDFLELIFFGLANGDIEKGHWLLDWAAHIVQKPHEKCSLVPVMIGEQGTGKGMFADRIMQAVLGHYHNKIDNPDVLMERFNKSQAFRLLTFLDETMWRGNKKEDGILKGLTGSRKMTVEEKFGGRYALNNYSRYIIASNNPEAVAIERSNRRYVVFEVNPALAGNFALFARLNDGLDQGALANHIFSFLISRDIKAFSPNARPNIDDGQGVQAKIMTNGIVAQFWADAFMQTPIQVWDEDEIHMHKEAAFREFLHFQKDVGSYQRAISRQVFWSQTYDFFGVDSRSETRKVRSNSKTRLLNLPPNKACCEMWKRLKLGAPPEIVAKDYVLQNVFE